MFKPEVNVMASHILFLSEDKQATSQTMLRFEVDETTHQALPMPEADKMTSHLLFKPETNKTAYQALFTLGADKMAYQAWFPLKNPSDHVPVQQSDLLPTHHLLPVSMPHICSPAPLEETYY